MNKESQENLKKEDLLIINNSPIEYGHALLVPDIQSHSCQVFTIKKKILFLKIIDKLIKRC